MGLAQAVVKVVSTEARKQGSYGGDGAMPIAAAGGDIVMP
jgi:hypothetical protein